MIKRGLTLVNAMQYIALPHITASAFINDDAGLWAGPAWRPVAQPRRPSLAGAHLKRQIMGREVVVAVTSGRLDFGTWERILPGQAEWLARES